MVQKLGLLLEETSGYGVLMGTWLAVKGTDICRSVSLTLQNIEIIEDFLPLELGSAHVILGMQWLESLGGMHVNWKTLSMQFQVGGVAVRLQGDPTLSLSLVSLKMMWKALRECREGVLIKLGNIELLDQPVDSPTSISLQRILDQFQSVFQPPSRLPPRRSRDHVITL